MEQRSDIYYRHEVKIYSQVHKAKKKHYVFIFLSFPWHQPWSPQAEGISPWPDPSCYPYCLTQALLLEEEIYPSRHPWPEGTCPWQGPSYLLAFHHSFYRLSSLLFYCPSWSPYPLGPFCHLFCHYLWPYPQLRLQLHLFWCQWEVERFLSQDWRPSWDSDPVHSSLD